MLFLSLTVDNFGVFRGKQTFELAPLFQNNEKHHLTIFHGHNGAGKSTIFQSLILALYGLEYFGNLTSTQGYHNFLRSRMHRSSTEEAKLSHDKSIGTVVRFQYVQSGRAVEVQVERQWKRYEHTFKEDLSILRDGQPLDVNPTDYQTWIDDLIPPGIGLLCFFDAEQLNALANEDQQSKVLKETLNRLLGLDWVYHLETDLQQYTFRQGSTKKMEALYAKVVELQAERDTIEYQLKTLRHQLDEINLDMASCESALTQQERRLAAEGGAYAARRPAMTSRLQTIQKEIDLLSGHLRELCTELLPFALAPELCLQLSERLALEFETRRNLLIGKLLEEKFSEIEKLLASDEIWNKAGIAEDSRRVLAAQLIGKLREIEKPQTSNDISVVHHLSEPEHQQLARWIAQSILDVPKQAQQIGKRLQILKREKQQIDTDLQRAPEDEILAPIHEELRRLREILANQQKRQTALNEQIGSLQFQQAEKRKQLQEVMDQYDKVRKNEKQLKYAEQTKNVLRTYKDALMHQKLRALEDALTDCFNKLCHKEHMLSGVQIDPGDLSIELKSTDGALLKLNDFSAGERQLYAMSLLWALRLISNLPLPLAIDTPLARLDETHRSRLMRDYIPLVSDQVLLFATDAEIDASLLDEASHQIARVYRLNYDAEQGETLVTLERELPRHFKSFSFLS